MSLKFTGERIVPGADNCEPTFARKMYQEHIARYEFASAFTNGADVLDVGCGVGYGAHHLATKGARSVKAFDIAPEAIAHARKEFGHPAVMYEVRSALDLDSEDAFDVVTCFELIEHVREQERVVAGIFKALRTNGVLLISTPRPHIAKRSKFHEQELSLEEFANLLRRHFANVLPCFESNYFTSFIGRTRPESIGHVVPLTNRFRLETADYFVFLASKTDTPDLEKTIRPTMTMEDDAYVQTLERDVAVLHDAEDHAKERIASLEAERETLRRDVENVRGGGDEVERLRHKLASSTAAMAELQSELTARRDEVVTLGMMLERVEGVASTAREALEVRTEALAAAEAHARSVEAAHAHELGQARMLHRVLQEHSDALKAMEARAGSAEAAHAHELGQARTLHRVLQEHADALTAERTRNERLQADMASLETEAERVPALSEALQATRDQLVAAEECLRSREADVGSLERRLATARQALSDSLTEGSRRVANLQAVIDDMRNSRVWRLATPLRRLARRGDRGSGKR